VGGAVGLAVLATLALRHATASIAHGAAAAGAYTQGTVLAFKVGSVVALVGALIIAFSPMATAAEVRAAAAAAGEAESDSSPVPGLEPVPA
jgi:hypothetical protein